MPLPIARLDSSDVDACVELSTGRGWRTDRRRWGLVFAVGEVYGIRDPAGGIAGTVALTRYGRGLATVGMMLVATRHARRGLGRRMLRHALHLAGDATVYLYATALGRPLYEQEDFRTIGAVTTAVGRFTGPPDGASRPAGPRDRDAILALDADAAGAEREQLIGARMAIASAVRVVEREGEPCAYAIAVPSADGVVTIGPLVAPDADAARSLVADLAVEAGRPVRLDIDHRQDGLRGWAASHGVEPQSDTALMIRATASCPAPASAS